jgi:hypothetical protein
LRGSLEIALLLATAIGCQTIAGIERKYPPADDASAAGAGSPPADGGAVPEDVGVPVEGGLE